MKMNILIAVLLALSVLAPAVLIWSTGGTFGAGLLGGLLMSPFVLYLIMAPLGVLIAVLFDLDET
jgi:hypothetical protein